MPTRTELLADHFIQSADVAGVATVWAWASPRRSNVALALELRDQMVSRRHAPNQPCGALIGQPAPITAIVRSQFGGQISLCGAMGSDNG
jgi:hypothetical protein